MDSPDSAQKWVYAFGAGAAEGAAGMRDLLGGKGANLAEMSNLGLPVPPGFTITTEVCTAFYAQNRTYPNGLEAQVGAALEAVGGHVDRVFGDPAKPLLVSVRSGSRASMPGMMDTVLNLGLNDATVEGMAVSADDARFAYDSYRRFIQMYADVVMGVDHHFFEEALDDYKVDLGVALDTALSADDWRQIIAEYKAIVVREAGRDFPQDPHEQLWGAIGAVFGSWMNERAKTYRRLHQIPENWGTAVNIQAMVFGNMGATSATGVAFTRDPSNGENTFYGEFLINAQGEDVVAGIRTPQCISKAMRDARGEEQPSMEEAMPDAYAQLRDAADRLERHYRDMQDIEFTVEQGRLWMLQTRTGKRTARAALTIAVDMARDGLITQNEVIRRVDANALEQLLHPALDPNAEKDLLVTGLPASPGAASGEVVFDADEAVRVSELGRPVILVRIETSPEDIHGMHAAVAIVTARGGMTSHAAVVARGMGRPCVSGAGDLRIDYADKSMRIGDRVVRQGEKITIDGAKGQVFFGETPTIKPELSGEFTDLMGWADGVRRMRVRANAETPTDAAAAREFGAEGIGLCRTEHMFFEADRIVAMREVILSDDKAERERGLAKLLPMQRGDFEELFQVMAGLPVTIRLLDPPLHEFLPHTDEEIALVAEASGTPASTLAARAAELRESNPMLGHRGCRVGLTYPEIYEMQARAVFEAAIAAGRATGSQVIPEIMIPLVGLSEEIRRMKALVDGVAQKVRAETGAELSYLVGTMIELPRAALRAQEIARHAEFFSFGTNDLTQTTLGVSRDDAGRFLRFYMSEGILETDPFVTLDKLGVGELVRHGAERGRDARADLKVGICGEHGGDPQSIAFFEEVGLDYVSCSPFRVPVARLAAAQAALDTSASNL